ncbi:TlpA disulfide reductase family protein [Sulfuriflexus sp.]|uniref:TlpA disulfide reductase family protein n=1 Tax=Sulfuriflexus sp. TaxID=2015443 RepID=UPI0028CF8110|nr:TlpA disulfide reductase family protein [Sulfuriflexus sp.]MDT8404933.1 TlpA disulfide reductase family protein [Sulfuriflexus sp.]
MSWAMLLPAQEGMEQMDVPVLDQTMTISRFPASGEELVIWVAPGFDSKTRALDMAARLAKRGIEVWRVDLAESLFLPQSTSTLRALDGRYVAGLVEQAHQQSGKNITLLGRSYAAIPILRGARQWQLNQAGKEVATYLNGAVLFSPELYATVPALGLEPVYVPVMSATNIPVMLYQADKRGNRWQLNDVLESLQKGGSAVYLKVLQGVTGVFYERDLTEAAANIFAGLADEIPQTIKLLRQTPTPLQAQALPENKEITSHGLDDSLKPYVGRSQPHPINLPDVNGQRFLRQDYRGKVTVVNFWATWCPPCVEEIPSLNRLRQAMQGKDFELVSIDYTEDKQDIEKFLQRVNVDFPVLLDSDGKVAASWGVLVFPSTFVIGPDGRIHYGVNGGIIWDSPEVIRKLNGLLGE